MKTITRALTLLLLNALSLTLYAQGWEREYGDYYQFNHAVALPNGRIAASDAFSFALLDAQGSPANDFGTSLSAIDVNQGYGITAGNLIALGNGSVTGLVAKGPHTLIYNADGLTGQLLWDTLLTLPAQSDTYYTAEKILSPGDSCYYLMGHWSSPEGKRPALFKVSLDGQLLWYKVYHPSLYSFVDYARAFDMAVTPSGELLMLVGQTSPQEAVMLRIGLDGALLEAIDWAAQSSDDWLNPEKLLVLPDGSFLVTGRQVFVSGAPVAINRIAPDGQVLWSTTLEGSPTYSYALKQRADGTIFVLGNQFDGNDSKIIVNALSADGQVSWWSDYPYPFTQIGYDMDILPDGGLLIAGVARKYQPNGQPNESVAYLLRLGANGQLYSSLVSGYVFEDLDEDCAPLPEAPLRGWLVAFEGVDTFYAITDTLGFYTRGLYPGTYQARAIPPNNYWMPCPPQTLSVPDQDTISANFPVQVAVYCPNLQVDISAPLLRRCFESRYTAYYCNSGAEPAENAFVEVELDPYLSFLSASRPVSSQQGQTLIFQLGDIDVGSCGQFYIDVYVDCDSTVLGQTHCTTAHIYPDSICLPAPDWSGASIEVDGSCSGDSIQFTIKNVGTAPSAIDPPLEYLVIEDQVILLQGSFSLDVGQAEQLRLASTGATYRIEAQQEPGHPGNSMPTATVEGCGLQNSGFSLGFATQYWENDGDPFISIDCQENVAAYDPNDKKAQPKGYGDEHLIEPNTDIEYHIRFQNTGTDTAFTVVIHDPLPGQLDITTVRPGASSHPYTYQITRDRTLEFRFDDILLPDSTANEPASHGFVKFKVKQRPGLPDGAAIDNTAFIYFDFNEAVVTNTYRHEVARDFIPFIIIPDDPNAATPLLVAPNPMVESAQMELAGYKGEGPIRLNLYDSLGRLVRRDQYPDARFSFLRGRLPEGIYFYQVMAGGRQLDSGKLIIQ
ncbi:MAG: T9SS type A sorting domain-containing protein [Phaeodactylibacter sp.]|nr:T9SS type A sorting domain-containing protein [Phaeodactylibacter sp.]MCB9275212.1 T9SS type A sorting domain-containing protein [Lewinellaceae bacterium]